MKPEPSLDVLFTGHAPVHYACFRPLGDRLRQIPGVRVFVAGGLKSVSDDATHYDSRGLYGPFGVPEDQILSVEEIRERDFDAVFAANTKLLRPRHTGAAVQVFHGISFRNKAVREANLGCDYYFLVGPYMKRRFVDLGLMSSDDPRGLSIGFLKTDRLVDGSLDRASLLQQYGLDASRPVILYAPTGQRHNSLETMGEEVLRRLSAAGHQVLLKFHDHPVEPSRDWVRHLEDLRLPGVHVSGESDVIPLLFCADLLISDASSVSSEDPLLDRPMVFLDVPELLKKSAKKDGAMDLDTWGRRGGDVVESPDSVETVVSRALADPSRHAEIRQAMARDLFFNPGRATTSALEWFRSRFLPSTTRRRKRRDSLLETPRMEHREP